jgi:LysR family transcriptional regulator, glycine cleavage system transcriptional activator
MQLPSLKALRAFEAAARTGSFLRAAAELHVTPSAVSHQVRGLEDELAASLFERRPRQLRLTPAGAMLAEAARAGFEAIAAGARRVAAARPRPVTLGVLPSFGVRWLLPRLPRFRSRCPGIELGIDSSREVAHFGRDDVDAAIRFAPRAPRGVHAERLLSEVLFPVCAPRLARRLRSPADLAGVPILHDDAEPRQGGWKEWLRAAGAGGVDWRRGTTFSDAHLMLEAVAASQGVALGRSALVERDLASGRLVRPFECAIPGRYQYWFVCPRGALRRPEVKAVRDFLVEAADARPGA